MKSNSKLRITKLKRKIEITNHKSLERNCKFLFYINLIKIEKKYMMKNLL